MKKITLLKKLISLISKNGIFPSYLHIGLVQVAVKPLTRKGINASVLMCLRDARFKKFYDRILGLITASLYDGPVYFDCYPDISLTLDDPNIVKALTLNVLTSSYDMDEGSKSFALIYRIHYRLLGTQLNPCAHTRIKDPEGKTMLIQCSTPDAKVQIPKMIQWQDINLPKEWLLEQEIPPTKPIFDELYLDHIQQYLDGTVKINLKLKVVSSNNSQVSTAFYSTKTKPPSTHSKHAIEEEEETESGSPTASDFQTTIIDSQLRVLSKNFEIDMVALFDEFKSANNKAKRKTYQTTFDQKEKECHIFFFEFLEKYYVSKNVSKNNLNMVNKSNFVKEDKTIVQSSHPLLETVLIDCKGTKVKASPFKIANADILVLRIIEQNNFTNTSLHIIGQQLDRIEEKFVEKPTSSKPEKPLIDLPKESRESIKKAVKKDDEGLPIFDGSIGRGILDGVNTLIYTIVKRFVGTPSNISSQISDYLNNLRCHCLKPYWREKFIAGLPPLFPHKVKQELMGKNDAIDYDNLTFGDIFSTIKKLGINIMSFIKPNDFYAKKKHTSRNYDKQKLGKGKCFNCGKFGHFSKDYHQKLGNLKNKLNMLNINDEDQEDLFRILETTILSDSCEEDFSSSSDFDYQSTETSYSPNIKIGCRDSCCNTVNVLSKTNKAINVLTKSEEQENLLINLISQIDNPELKEEYFKKLKKTLIKDENDKRPKSKISLDETLERFNKKKSKELTVNELQHEIAIIKEEIIELKNEFRIVKTDNFNLKQERLLFKIDKQLDNPQTDSEPDEQGDYDDSRQQAPLPGNASTKNKLNLVNKMLPPKWLSKVKIFVCHE
ncbi:hypothetical protein ACB092_08G083300 [Castanea dentata]